MPVERAEKDNDWVRIRNRRYKIKRILAQPRNIDVRHNGRLVRRMVVRRSTIYPSTRQMRILTAKPYINIKYLYFKVYLSCQNVL